MAGNERKRGLGRGLSALMADVSQVEPERTDVQMAVPGDQLVPIENVHPNVEQPRRSFDSESLSELASSISTKGVLQPLIVRHLPGKEGEYEIVAGERRWRASQQAGLHEIPVIVRDFNDNEVLEVAIIENVQRADLNPIEEAIGYKQLMEKFGRTQEVVAEALGKSRSHIANLLRLLNLPEDIQAHVVDGKLSMGHARALLSADDPHKLAMDVIANGLSVRETERLAKSKNTVKDVKPRKSRIVEKDPDTIALESELSAHLGLSVVINHKDGDAGGTLVLSYQSFEQLDDLCRLLSGE